jgi:4-hydroxy-tetrahydrodipicolinate synthase
LIKLEQIKGVVCPIVTPFQADGATVHERGVHQLVERLIGQGAHGIFPGGTTGEVWALDDEQWSRLIRFCVEAARGRAPVYAGISQPSTAGAVARAKKAEQLGADLVVSLAPYYAPPSQGDIIRHFQAVAAASALPVIVYQFPGIVKASIALPTYAELAQMPNIVGVKDSLADVTEFRHMLNLLRGKGQDFRLFLGSDILADCAVLMGAQGVVPSISNVIGHWLVEAYDCAVAGQWERSRLLLSRAVDLKAMYQIAATGSIFDGLIAGLKGALELLGVEAGPPAPPLARLNAEQMRTLEGLLRTSGVLG